MEVCLTILGVMLLALTPAILIVVFAVIKARKRRKFQEEILQTKAHLLSKGKWFAVRYASEKKYKKFLKWFPWEASGILFIREREAIFFSNKLPKEYSGAEELYFNLKDVKIKWLGITHWWKNGFVSWFEIESFGGKHYFTSETGTFIFGSGVSVHQIYDELLRQHR